MVRVSFNGMTRLPNFAKIIPFVKN